MYMLNMYPQHRLIDESRCGRSDNRNTLERVLSTIHCSFAYMYTLTRTAHTAHTAPPHANASPCPLSHFRAPRRRIQCNRTLCYPAQTHTHLQAFFSKTNVLTISIAIDSRRRADAAPALDCFNFWIRNGCLQNENVFLKHVSFYV